MKILELDRRECREEYGGNWARMLEVVRHWAESTPCVIWDNEKIRHAFNGGEGTPKDMRRMMRDNRIYCRFYDLEKETFIY